MREKRVYYRASIFKAVIAALLNHFPKISHWVCLSI